MKSDHDVLPELVPPLPRKVDWRRSMSLSAPFGWLSAGWSDLTYRPMTSLMYGVLVFLLSAVLFGALFYYQYDYILFPAIAGFMVVGPALAAGLYNKSRLIAAKDNVSVQSTMPSWTQAGGQIAFVGVLLVLLVAVWIRAAVLIYALFFGLLPFTNLEDQFWLLFTTLQGFSLLVTGTFVGGLFAAFSFSISVFSIPMLLEERTDAFTAMGVSMSLVWANLPVMLVWGSIVLAMFLLSCLTGFLGLIIVFPLLGHATWHAYNAMRHS